MACLAFYHIWCFMPTLRIVKINCALFRMINQVMLAGCCGPMYEMYGLLFSKIKIKYQKVPDGDEKDELTV